MKPYEQRLTELATSQVNYFNSHKSNDGYQNDWQVELSANIIAMRAYLDGRCESLSALMDRQVKQLKTDCLKALILN